MNNNNNALKVWVNLKTQHRHLKLIEGFETTLLSRQKPGDTGSLTIQQGKPPPIDKPCSNFHNFSKHY